MNNIMTTIEELIENYQSERTALVKMQKEGIRVVEFATWDFRSAQRVEREEEAGIDYDYEIKIEEAIAIIDSSLEEMKLPDAKPEDFNY